MTDALWFAYLLALAVSLPLGPAFTVAVLASPGIALYGAWEFARWLLVPQTWWFEGGKWKGYPR